MFSHQVLLLESYEHALAFLRITTTPLVQVNEVPTVP